MNKVKTNLKKIIKKENIILYLLSVYFGISTTYSKAANSIIIFGLFIFVVSVIYFFMFKLIYEKFIKYNIKTRDKEKITKFDIFTYFLIIFIFCAIFYITLYPGGFSNDTLSQYEQAINNTYNNWHPVIHTFIIYKLPTLLIENYNIVIIWQLFLISILLTAICYWLRKLGFSNKIVYIFLEIILLNPINIRMFTMPWKDIAYSFMLLLSTIIMIFIVKSNGKWLNNYKNITLLSIVLFFILGFRHNGLISFVFIILALLFLYQKYFTKILIICILSLVPYLIITGPVYKALDITPHDSFAEILGVPLNQISYIYNKHGNITQEDYSELQKLGDLKVWRENFNIRSFNYIKFIDGAVDIEYINTHRVEVIKLYISLVKNNPKMALISYYYVTSPIWSIEKNTHGTNIALNKSNTISNHLNYFFTYYENWLMDIKIGQFLGYGGSLFLIILSIIIISLKNKFYLKKYLPFIPTISSTLGIMLLITGGELRFVYSNVICAIPLFIYSLSDLSNKKNASNDDTLLKKLFINKTTNTFLQFFRYIFVGGIAAVCNILSLLLFTEITKIYYIISSILGFIIGLIVNYTLSKLLVFTNEKFNNKKKEFINYTFIGIIGLAIDTLFMYVFTSIFSIYYLLSKILSTIITFVWNFTARKLMYFMERKNDQRN